MHEFKCFGSKKVIFKAVCDEGFWMSICKTYDL